MHKGEAGDSGKLQLIGELASWWKELTWALKDELGDEESHQQVLSLLLRESQRWDVLGGMKVVDGWGRPFMSSSHWLMSLLNPSRTFWSVWNYH